jgi:hypothetical protein
MDIALRAGISRRMELKPKEGNGIIMLLAYS